MKHTLSILLQNEPGALLRVTGLFAARHVNIDALTVAVTHDPSISQLTVVLEADERTQSLVMRHLMQQVDVLDASCLSLASDGSGKLQRAVAV